MSDVVDAAVDLQTGAWRRARFEEELARQVSLAHRGRLPLSVLYVDLDELQEHNDLLGAAEGDALLAQVAELIAREADGRGPLGRISGGAFALRLDGADLAEAVALAERIRRTISARLSRGAVRVTVSVGVAALRLAEPWGNLLEAAQTASIRAKQAGRNTVATR